MNRFEKFLGRKGEAKLRYLDAEYQVVVAGDYVTCAVTGQRIPVDDLRYWSVERQEPYLSAEVSFKRYLETRDEGASGGERPPGDDDEADD